MTTLYLETSALLCWLFGEPNSEVIREAINASSMIITSELTRLEARRAILRFSRRVPRVKEQKTEKLHELLTKHERQWNFATISQTILQRAAGPFPREPVRSLDAIHLATALELSIPIDDLAVLSCDGRILSNLHPLGLRFVSSV